MRKYIYTIAFVLNLFVSFAQLDTFPRIAITDPSIPAPSPYIIKTFQWKYGGYQFTTDIKLKRADYDYYRSLSKNQPYQVFAEDHTSNPYLVDLCKQLDEDAKQLNYNGLDLVNYLTAFVQQAVPYKSEIGEIKKYPIETLMEFGGDCEDKSALLASLLNTYGFDAAMVLLPGHMAVAVSTTNMGGYYNHNGKRYSFIETTSGGWRIGDVPSENQTVGATILDVKHTAYFKRVEEQNFSDTNNPDSDDTYYDPSKDKKNWKSSYKPLIEPQTSPKTVYVPVQTTKVVYCSPTTVYNSGCIAPQSMYQQQQYYQPLYNCNPPVQIRSNNGCMSGGSISLFGNTVLRW